MENLNLNFLYYQLEYIFFKEILYLKASKRLLPEKVFTVYTIHKLKIWSVEVEAYIIGYW